MEDDKESFAKRNKKTKPAVAFQPKRFEPKDNQGSKRFGVNPSNNNVRRPFQEKGRPTTWILDENAYYNIHKGNGHMTKDSSVLTKHLTELWASGDLTNFNIEDSVKKYHEERATSENQAPLAKRPRSSNEEEPRSLKGKIHVILGGSKLYRDSINAIKKNMRNFFLKASLSEEIDVPGASILLEERNLPPRETV